MYTPESRYVFLFVLSSRVISLPLWSEYNMEIANFCAAKDTSIDQDGFYYEDKQNVRVDASYVPSAGFETIVLTFVYVISGLCGRELVVEDDTWSVSEYIGKWYFLTLRLLVWLGGSLTVTVA